MKLNWQKLSETISSGLYQAFKNPPCHILYQTATVEEFHKSTHDTWNIHPYFLIEQDKLLDNKKNY